MPVYDYAIGSSNPPTNVESLTTPLNVPRGRYYEAAQWLDKSDGNQRGQGFPTARWEFDTLTQEMIDQLRTFCPGQSAQVYITTRINDGTFVTFSAVMWWPGADQTDKRLTSEVYSGLQFIFKRLQAV